MPALAVLALVSAHIAANEVSVALAVRSSSASGAAALLPEDTSCYYKVDPTFKGAIETGGGRGRSYRGLVGTTVSGRTCQKWTATHPWGDTADYKPVTDKQTEDGVEWGNGLGDHNYCRNPDQSKAQPWCFTMDTSESHKWELCDIPECPEEERDFQSEHKQTVAAIKAIDCQCMDELYGNSRTTKDTSVPTYMGLVQKAGAAAGTGGPVSAGAEAGSG
eukprot:CAMPEP_0179053634 /NCGR_PEP_ID=MMETSP0796-20121207/22373_1 /TAXON_ID=73915 /ORGANISM="Pyrodinium bahamense, Strain pbaha01" /LENGTH=218 /DNA_ID=CAMNT_0020750235 /DNA_START=77 /DNA_END=730 /DNA_ORIENTATION=-